MNLIKSIKSDKLTLVNFHATWCGPCKMMKPYLDEVADKYKDDINYERIDVDQNTDLARQFDIRSVPTTIILKDGETKWRHSGVFPAKDIMLLIDQHL